MTSNGLFGFGFCMSVGAAWGLGGIAATFYGASIEAVLCYLIGTLWVLRAETKG